MTPTDPAGAVSEERLAELRKVLTTRRNRVRVLEARDMVTVIDELLALRQQIASLTDQLQAAQCAEKMTADENRGLKEQLAPLQRERDAAHARIDELRTERHEGLHSATQALGKAGEEIDSLKQQLAEMRGAAEQAEELLSSFSRKQSFEVYRADIIGAGMRLARALSSTERKEAGTQARVHEWMLECFGAEIAADKTERSHRFIEEALELVQAAGITRDEVMMLVEYTFGRPVGELQQEVGGVMVTLAALCTAHGVNMDECANTEIRRVWGKIEQIRSKQAGKPRGSPLPTPPPKTPQTQGKCADCGDDIRVINDGKNAECACGITPNSPGTARAPAAEPLLLADRMGDVMKRAAARMAAEEEPRGNMDSSDIPTAQPAAEREAIIEAELDNLVHAVRSHERSPDKYAREEVTDARSRIVALLGGNRE